MNADRATAGARRSAAEFVEAAVRACGSAVLDERARWYLWSPVLLATGAVVYFQLYNEPGVWTVAIVGALGIGAALAARRSQAIVAGIAVLLLAAGFVLAKTRTFLVAAPVLPQAAKIYGLSGWVEDIEQRAGGRWRARVRVMAFDDLADSRQPYRVRISLPNRYGSAVSPGDLIKARARLRGPSEPAYPGGFDFARRAWFARIGGFGFSVSAVEKIADAPPRPFLIAMMSSLETLRRAIAGRVHGQLSGVAGAVAVALITGKRGTIPADALKAIRDAGLGHLLAISGLHMVLMAGSLFWLIRALLALVPRLSLNFPIKKWSAATALAGGFGYLLLSGAAVSTQRAFIMLAVMFVAVLIDRPAISLRNVATAALVVLLLRPESVLDVGFQMSFATVTGLIALFDARSLLFDRRFEFGNGFAVTRYLRRSGAYLGGILLTTLVATLVTGPIAAYHFNRIALYGLAANLIAIPLMGLLIMPMAGLALAAMPFGAEAPFLFVMGQGIDAVIATARTVSQLPGAVAVIAQGPAWPVVLFVAGGLWFCLWQRRWRYFGLIGLVTGLAAAGLTGRQYNYDILIDRQLAVVAMRNEQGQLALTPTRRGRYSARRWLAMDGDRAPVAEAARRSGFRCDARGCVADLAPAGTLAIVTHPAILREECLTANVLITMIAPRGSCPAPKLIVTRRDLFWKGAHALTWTGAAYRLVSVASVRGNRPWSKAVDQRPRKNSTSRRGARKAAGL